MTSDPQQCCGCDVLDLLPPTSAVPAPDGDRPHVDGQQHVLEFGPWPRETDDAFAARIIREIARLEVAGEAPG